MEITLMCPGASSGQSAFPAELVEGIPTPERRYNIIDGSITLAGFSEAVLHHDADVLLSMSLFRMPTPQEQEQMAAAQVQSGTIQESTEQTEDETLDTPLALDTTSVDTQSPDGDSTAQSKKKASGG